MENLPISSKYRSAPNTPVRDAEREQLVGQLNRAFTEGEVGETEYHDLLDQAFAATTMGELAPVASALPVRAPETSPGPATPAGQPGQVNVPREPRQTAKITGAVLGVLIAAGLLALFLTLIII